MCTHTGHTRPTPVPFLQGEQAQAVLSMVSLPFCKSSWNAHVITKNAKYTIFNEFYNNLEEDCHHVSMI
jgi:hypothetical protein